MIYVLGEGVSRFPLRMKAWCAEHDTTPAALIRKKSFVLVPRALNLLDAEAVQTFLADVVAPAVQKAGKQVSMIVFDTWSRCVAGAENDEAFNLAVGHIDEIRRVTNATVVALHHTPKDGRATARGSGVLEGAIDAQVVVRGDTRSHEFECEMGFSRDIAPEQFPDKVFEKRSIQFDDAVDPDSGEPEVAPVIRLLTLTCLGSSDQPLLENGAD